MTNNIAALPAKMTQTLQEWSHHVSGAPTAASILLTHGTTPRRAALAPLELRGPAGYCYSNSVAALAQLAAGDGWRYCEGYAFSTKFGFVFEHAWLLGPDDVAWETTWPSTAGVTYLGLAFEPIEVIRLLEESDEPLLFGDWSRGFRLYQSHRRCCGVPTTK